ncbi:MAG TPA: hypothetical protein PKA55_05555 [Rhodoblastus sp.]|mgnify:CR=1 FL=1|nr:hypothetical protein [Rhodoblastus sp.]
MRSTSASPALLLRCADAAGYGAVSFEDDEPAARRGGARRGLWRAILSLLFVLA